MCQFPSIPLGGAHLHPFSANLQIRMHPNHLKPGAHLRQPSTHLLQPYRIAHLTGKGRINEHAVVEFQRLKGDLEDCVIFIIAYILLKKGRAANQTARQRPEKSGGIKQ